MTTEERPGASKHLKVLADAEAILQAQLKFSDFSPRKMPDFSKTEAEVKLNIAMLKREKVLLDKEESTEAARVKALAEGMKDASEFNEWRAEMD